MRKTHPLLRRVGNAGSRVMLCNCDAYPYPHESETSVNCLNAYMKYSYEVARIMDYNLISGYHFSIMNVYAPSLEAAFDHIDLLMELNPDWLFGVACRGQWIFVPKNL